MDGQLHPSYMIKSIITGGSSNNKNNKDTIDTGIFIDGAPVSIRYVQAVRPDMISTWRLYIEF